MCVLVHLLICTALRAHIIVVEALYKINYYYYIMKQSKPGYSFFFFFFSCFKFNAIILQFLQIKAVFVFRNGAGQGEKLGIETATGHSTAAQSLSRGVQIHTPG